MMAATNRHRVVVTGLGPLTAIGHGVDPFWRAVLEGRSGTRAVSASWVNGWPFKSRIGAPVEDPPPERANLTAREAQLLDPATLYALAATAMALEDAGFAVRIVEERPRRLRVEGVDPERAGVILGTGIGGLTTLEKSHRQWVHSRPLAGTFRFSLPMLIPNALPAQVAIQYGFRGECKAVTTACASGTMAIGDAYRLLRDGELDLAITGGVDKTLSDFDGYSLLGFDLLRTLSSRNDDPEHASRPFDRDRDGFVLGEGAGVLVLETEEHARARGARVYAEVAGYASTCDAFSMLQMDPSGEELVRVMDRAIRSADIGREDVVYVNAHGTSTRAGDAQEARALQRVFGRRIANVLVNSTKAMIGHAIGAAGGIEAIVTVLSLAHRVVHRCVNLESPDPDCDLPLPRENRSIRPLAALSNSFAFGGHNATVVLRAP